MMADTIGVLCGTAVALCATCTKKNEQICIKH